MLEDTNSPDTAHMIYNDPRSFSLRNHCIDGVF